MTMSLRDKLSVADIRVLEDVNTNVRRWPTEVRDLINHLMELAQADRESEDKPKPTPKFKVGDKVVAKVSDENIKKGWIGRVTAVGMNFVQVRFANYPSELYNVRMDMLAPYTEPTAEEGEEKLQSSLAYEDTASSFLTALREETVLTPDEKWLKWFNGEATRENEEKRVVEEYRKELAAKIAVAYAEKGRYEPYEIGAKAVEVTNGVINGLKNTDI